MKKVILTMLLFTGVFARAQDTDKIDYTFSEPSGVAGVLSNLIKDTESKLAILAQGSTLDFAALSLSGIKATKVTIVHRLGHCFVDLSFNDSGMNMSYLISRDGARLSSFCR